MEETKAVAVREERYPILAGAQNASELIRANIGNGQMTAFDLERIKIPTGGGTAWLIPGLAGETQQATLRGIIVHYQDVRAYWKEEFSGDQPPDCSSDDCKTGHGDPGGECSKCPYAAFGSGKGGSGQACKQIRRLFLLTEGTFLPFVIALPPTSLKPCRQYMLRVTNAGLPYWGVVTEIGLEKTKNAGGIAYAKTTFKAAQEGGTLAALTPEQAAKVHEYADGLRAALARLAVGHEDYVISADEQ